MDHRRYRHLLMRLKIENEGWKITISLPLCFSNFRHFSWHSCQRDNIFKVTSLRFIYHGPLNIENISRVSCIFNFQFPIFNWQLSIALTIARNVNRIISPTERQLSGD